MLSTDAPSRPSFRFQERHGKLDLRAISRVDVDKVVMDTDIDTLQAHLANITFARLQPSDLRSYTDDNIVKLFQLTQLTIEYMMNVQTTLHGRAVELERQCEQLSSEVKRSEQDRSRQDDDMEDLRRELHAKRKTCRTYEALLLQARANGPGGDEPKARVLGSSAAPTELYKCEGCGKLFRTAEFLDAHRRRRHPDLFSAVECVPVPAPAPVVQEPLRASIDEALLRDQVRKQEETQAKLDAAKEKAAQLELTLLRAQEDAKRDRSAAEAAQRSAEDTARQLQDFMRTMSERAKEDAERQAAPAPPVESHTAELRELYELKAKMEAREAADAAARAARQEMEAYKASVDARLRDELAALREEMARRPEPVVQVPPPQPVPVPVPEVTQTTAFGDLEDDNDEEAAALAAVRAEADRIRREAEDDARRRKEELDALAARLKAEQDEAERLRLQAEADRLAKLEADERQRKLDEDARREAEEEAERQRLADEAARLEAQRHREEEEAEKKRLDDEAERRRLEEEAAAKAAADAAARRPFALSSKWQQLPESTLGWTRGTGYRTVADVGADSARYVSNAWAELLPAETAVSPSDDGDGDAPHVRVPASWTLELQPRGPGSSGLPPVRVSVTVRTTIREVRTDASREWRVDLDTWRLCNRRPTERPSDGSRPPLVDIPDGDTVEAAQLFMHRPEVKRTGELSDDQVDAIVKAYLRAQQAGIPRAVTRAMDDLDMEDLSRVAEVNPSAAALPAPVPSPTHPGVKSRYTYDPEIRRDATRRAEQRVMGRLESVGLPATATGLTATERQQLEDSRRLPTPRTAAAISEVEAVLEANLPVRAGAASGTGGDPPEVAADGPRRPSPERQDAPARPPAAGVQSLPRRSPVRQPPVEGPPRRSPAHHSPSPERPPRRSPDQRPKAIVTPQASPGPARDPPARSPAQRPPVSPARRPPASPAGRPPPSPERRQEPPRRSPDSRAPRSSPSPSFGPAGRPPMPERGDAPSVAVEAPRGGQGPDIVSPVGPPPRDETPGPPSTRPPATPALPASPPGSHNPPVAMRSSPPRASRATPATDSKLDETDTALEDWEDEVNAGIDTGFAAAIDSGFGEDGGVEDIDEEFAM